MAAEDHTDSKNLFRPQAIEHDRFGGRRQGEVLRLSPSWMGWTFRLIVGFFLVSFLYMCLGKINEYAAGPAVVRAAAKIEVTCPAVATVQDVAVVPGERVQVGQLLVRLNDEEQAAAVRRAEQELDVQLAVCLRDPLDESARRSAASLRFQLEYAGEMLATRQLTAPEAGVVRDVRIRPGQSVTPGQLLVTISRADNRLSLIVMLPGYYQPQLAVGQPGRFEISGYPHTYQPVMLDQVSDDLVGPAEVYRYVGHVIADAIAVSGTVVLAEATLVDETFTADGRQYHYVDGMLGQVQVKVRSIPIILSLVPGLRSIWEGGNRDFSE